MFRVQVGEKINSNRGMVTVSEDPLDLHDLYELYMRVDCSTYHLT